MDVYSDLSLDPLKREALLRGEFAVRLIHGDCSFPEDFDDNVLFNASKADMIVAWQRSTLSDGEREALAEEVLSFVPDRSVAIIAIGDRQCLSWVHYLSQHARETKLRLLYPRSQRAISRPTPRPGKFLQ